MRSLTIIVACALAATAWQHAIAQAAADPAARAPAGRPKVCVVLSGGGARGAAHIGVLRVLEELRVPVDCIAGTSMGSLVGGAYASGMTIDEMDALVGTITTQLLFREKPPRQDETIRRKLDDATVLFGLELGLRNGEILLQKGVVSGVQLESVLRKLSKIRERRNFDDLPIPFRAVATDLVAGKAVVIDHGELAHAMRASMSVPTAIAPAQMDDMLLVDGGLTDNLPVGVARAMGADIVIAVNLGTPLMTRDELGSVLGITGQMIGILTEQNVRASLASLKPTDILIEPALGNFSAADFDHLPKTIPIGEAATRLAANRLSALSLTPEAYAQLRAHQSYAEAPPSGVVADVRFRGLERVNPDSLVDLMDTRAGQALDQERLDRDLRRLFGTGDFEHLDYRIFDESGRQIVSVDAIEKSWGPNYLRFGLGLLSDFKGGNAFNLAASYRRTWMNSLGGEWRTDVQMGQTGLLRSEVYQPLGTRHGLFVAPRVLIDRQTVDVYEGSDRIARYDLRGVEAGVDLGAEFTRYGEVRVGVLVGRTRPSLDTGPPQYDPPGGSVARGAFRFRAIVDQLNSLNFPREGYAMAARVLASSKALGADDVYTKWDVDAAGAYSWGRHTLTAGFRGGGPIGSDPLPVYDLEQWGGFLHQSGYPAGALLGQRLTFGRLIYSYRLHEQKLLDGLYAGMSLEAGRMDNPLVPGNLTGLLKSAAVFLGADTPVGPFYLGYGFAADGSRSAYLFLGRP